VAQLASKPTTRMPQKHSMFQNATLAIAGGVLHVAMMYAVVAMAMDDEKGRYVANDQSIKILAYHGVLNFDFCKRHASNILSYTRKSVDAWKDMAAANHEPENKGDGWPKDG